MSKTRLKLFQAFGIELEYMIVDRDTLMVKPIADELLKLVSGNYHGDFENGKITWSNELVLHVVELKTTKPEPVEKVELDFHKNIVRINQHLKQFNAMLMPTAAHPLMSPATETKLWPHDNNEIYAVYNKIFDCRGHGWSNLQSTHLNLPFSNEDEFGRLHAATRMILPILPALCASSPILDGKLTGLMDTRMKYYKTNQAAIPSITGKVIPEPVFTEADYEKQIYKAIAKDIKPHDPDGVLEPLWVNSRGAMARFDRHSIEIRIMDIQECPAADLAIQTLVIQTLKSLVNEQFFSYKQQKEFSTDALASILDATIAEGQKATINDEAYLRGWGLDRGATALDVWDRIFELFIFDEILDVERCRKELSVIMSEGTLSDRILRALRGDFSRESILSVYGKLCRCLDNDTIFNP